MTKPTLYERIEMLREDAPESIAVTKVERLVREALAIIDELQGKLKDIRESWGFVEGENNALKLERTKQAKRIVSWRSRSTTWFGPTRQSVTMTKPTLDERIEALRAQGSFGRRTAPLYTLIKDAQVIIDEQRDLLKRQAAWIAELEDSIQEHTDNET